MGRKNYIKYVLAVCLAVSICFGSDMWVRASGEIPIENADGVLEENTNRVTEKNSNEGEETRNPDFEDGGAEDSGEQTDNLSFIELPSEYESGHSPFDFILDPQGVINATGAVRYGGRSFEEGATMYFENTDGEYDFSGRSDELSIINKGTTPVRITISAALKNIGDVRIVGDDFFADSTVCWIYLAITDNKGNYVPLDEHGEAVIHEEINGAVGESPDVVYSFCLTGSCNPNGDWGKISDIPYVAVDWSVEPIINEETEMESDTLEEQPIWDDVGATASANVA